MKALYFDNDLKKIIMLKAASVFNRYAALGVFSPLSYAEVPDPEIPNPRWLKVSNKACGLCGTDVHFMFMDMDPKCFSAAIPGVSRKFLGHELVGRVTETGDEVDDFAPGDRVVLRIDWPSCHQMEIDPLCPSCQKGDYLQCSNLGLGQYPMTDVGGGFSPKMVMHKDQPFKVPDGIDDDHALLIEPVACSVHGVLKKAPEPGEKVLVIGAGTIGLTTVLVVKHLFPEAEVHCIARHPYQMEAAKSLGADKVWKGGDLYEQLAKATGARFISGHFGNRILLGGFDVIYDTVGSDRSINDALRWARPKGTVVILGINFMPGKIDYTTIWNQELTVIGMNSHATEPTGENSFEMASKIIAAGKAPAEVLITHRFAMDDYKKAVKAFMNKKDHRAIKIVLDHQDG